MADSLAKSQARFRFSSHRPLVKFAADDNGGVAIIFAFTGVVMLLMAGLAVDVGRMMMARSALVDAADAAGLAAGRALADGLKATDAVKTAEAYFEANGDVIKRSGAAIPTPEITADTGGQVVTVEASVVVPMTLMQVGGFKSVTIPVRSEVRYDAKDLEVGVAIDVTGSMNNSIKGERKIDSLKKAFKNFVETVIPEELPLGRTVRIGVAPYSASINLGPYAKTASDSNSTDGCVTERIVKQYSDKVPGAGLYFAAKKDGVSDLDGSANDYSCPPAQLIPLTGKRDELTTAVDKYGVGGYTGGHFGTQWAWNLVSEDYGSFWGGQSKPDEYSKVTGPSPKLIKAVILMTDGVNNIAFRHGRSREQQIALCTAMKDRGVKVFSVGFGLDYEPNATQREEAKDTLRQCASPGPEYFADASDAAQLDTAFRQFAAVLGKLRVSQ